MNDIKENIQVIYIGLVVATFLYMTGRSRKAIDLCSESLVLLNKKAVGKEEQFNEFLSEAIYKVMFAAYLIVRDYTNAITYGRNLLVIERQRARTVQEEKLCIKLASIYQAQNKYVKAK